MHIAHITATFPPYYGGTGIVCYHNAVGLARLGHDVTVFTAQLSNGAHEDPPEIAVRRLPALFRLGNAPFLPGLLGLDGFDIVHLHHPFIFGAEMVWAACKARGIPYILTHHNDLIGDGIRHYYFEAYSTISGPLVFSGARRFAVVSLDHAANCRLAPILRKRWHDVVEIPNGVDTNLFHPDVDGESVRQQHGIPGDDTILLFVGALDRAHHYRRVDLLFEALGSLDNPHVWLLVVGDGDLGSYYRSMVARSGLESRVRFLGSVAPSALPSIYTAADILVLPSQLQESFGMVVIEAMACAKPVLVSDLPGVRSVVCDSVDGLLARPGDVDDLAGKIQWLLDHPDRVREMGQMGRVKVEEKYTWPVIIPRLARVYEEVVGRESMR